MKLRNTLTLLQAVRSVKTTILYPQSEISQQQIALVEGYSQLRTDFVVQENWPLHYSGIDTDEYDVRPDSAYVIAYVGSRVVAGMRATKITSLHDSLSFGMWHNATEKEQFEAQLKAHDELIETLKSKDLWDITRLIAETSVRGEYEELVKAHSRVGLLKVMSAGVSVAEPGADVVWVFTTNSRLLRFMQRSHINTHVLASGRISETDEDAAHLCVAYPHEIISELKRLNPAVHRIATRELKNYRMHGI